MIIRIFFFILFSQYALASEISFRLLNGMFTYDSEVLSGSTTTIASPSIQYHYKLSENFSIGANYEIHINTTEQTSSLYALGVSTKYTVHKSSASTTVKDDSISIESHARWEIYLTFLLNRYSYFLGENQTENKEYEQTGNFVNADFGIGTNYTISSSYKVFTEGSMTIISFAGSDDRIKLKSVILSFGLTKEF